MNKRLPRRPLLVSAFIAQRKRWVIIKCEVIMCIPVCVNVGIAFVLSPFGIHYSTRHISPDSSRTSSITSTPSCLDLRVVHKIYMVKLVWFGLGENN